MLKPAGILCRTNHTKVVFHTSVDVEQLDGFKPSQQIIPSMRETQEICEHPEKEPKPDWAYSE